MRGRAHVKLAMTQQQAEVQMRVYLYGCDERMLPGITVASLLRTYRVTEEVAVASLDAARKDRGVAA